MGIVAEAKRIKEVHPDFIMLYKSGSFYKTFGKDAYILSALFNYNISIVNNNVATCGFPLKSISKVRSRIEELKISYMLIDPRNNYEVDLKEDFRNLNNYALCKIFRPVKVRHLCLHRTVRGVVLNLFCF